MKEEYYIDEENIRYCYPYDIDRRITDATNYGVLEKYIGKKFTREEIDQIISEMVINHPYIDNSKHLHVSIMRNRSYYHILDFCNYDYDNQERGDLNIKYEK